jgi:hypothetical protein
MDSKRQNILFTKSQLCPKGERGLKADIIAVLSVW